MTAPPAGARKTARRAPIGSDKPREACGVFGIFGHPDAAAHTALGLHALQHRGQESAGIVSTDGALFHSHRALGRVGDIFASGDVIASLSARSANSGWMLRASGAPRVE